MSLAPVIFGGLTLGRAISGITPQAWTAGFRRFDRLPPERTDAAFESLFSRSDEPRPLRERRRSAEPEPRPRARRIEHLVTASNNLAASDDLAPATVRAFERRTVDSHPGSSLAGLLIINADDWGRDIDTTNRILECVLCGSVSSTSGMVFMEDSERAASVARERGVDVGLHLNVTTPFSVAAAPSRFLSIKNVLLIFYCGTGCPKRYITPD